LGITKATDYAVFASHLEAAGEDYLLFFNRCGDSLPISLFSYLLVQPGDKEDVSEPSMQHRCSREEAIRVCLMKREKADLIANAVSSVAKLLLRPT